VDLVNLLFVVCAVIRSIRPPLAKEIWIRRKAENKEPQVILSLLRERSLPLLEEIWEYLLLPEDRSARSASWPERQRFHVLHWIQEG